MTAIPRSTHKPGSFVCVVGPSGAGKDTLLDAARSELAGDTRFVFPRRIITRPAGSTGEDHVEVSPQRFRRMDRQGHFCLNWEAHGLSYGLPADCAHQVSAGKTVVANVSRAVLADAQARYSRLLIVNITADPAVLAERLADRGRETETDIEQRLAREFDLPHTEVRLVSIENSGSMSAAVDRFLEVLRFEADTGGLIRPRN